MLEHDNSDLHLQPQCPHCTATTTEKIPTGRRCLNCEAEFTPRRVLPRVRFTGIRTTAGCKVSVIPLPRSHAKAHTLDLRLDLWNHSPTGFEWGYSGSGPAQLALAILTDILGPGREDLAIKLHQAFKSTIVARLPADDWTLETPAIAAWLNSDTRAQKILASWREEFPGDALVVEQDD